MKNTLVGAISLFVILTACNYTAEVSGELNEEPYFDLPNLVQQQLAQINSLQPSVEIVARIGDQQESQTVKKDSADWAETLKLFSDVNINRPVLQGSYSVKDSSDQQHGWQAKVYRAKQPDKVEVPYLIVYYQGTLEKVQRIETEFREKNPLYRTSRQLTMQLEPVETGSRLVSYQSSGSQKMIFRDRVDYFLKARLLY